MDLNFFYLILISISLSLDCFAVTCGISFKEKILPWNNILKMSFSFGFFQSIMPFLGFLTGKFTFNFLKSIDHWIAFFILISIGFKMVLESFEKNNIEKNFFNFKNLILLSIATSLDAFGVGFSLSLLGYGILLPVILFGITTFFVSIGGFNFGKKIKKYFGKKIEIFGGIILILIGFKILFEHLKII